MAHIIDLITWISKEDFEKGYIGNIADYLLFDDKENFYAFFGNLSSLTILSNRLASSNNMGKAIIPIEIDNEVCFARTIKDIEQQSVIHTRYSTRAVKDALIHAFESELTTSEIELFQKKKLDFSSALSSKNAEKKIQLLKKRYPNLKVIIFQLTNKSFGKTPNPVAIILDESIVLKDEIMIAGFGSIKKTNLTLKKD